MDSRDRIADVLRRPGAYGLRTFEQATAFMVGFDAAFEWTFLQGFREWLAREVGEGENLSWPVLASRLRQVQEADSINNGASRQQVDARMDAFFDALRRFLELPEE